MKENLIYNSNKKMVAYLLANGCKVHDVALGRNETLLFGFDKSETYLLAQLWFERENEQKPLNI